MTENVHVHGQVRLPEGRPAGGAVVTLLDGQGTQVGYAETAADGGYRVTPRGPGRYLLVAAAPERDPWVGYVTVDAMDEVLVPLAHQLLSEREGESAARHGRREDAATPENIRAFVRPLIEAMATDMRDRTAT